MGKKVGTLSVQETQAMLNEQAKAAKKAANAASKEAKMFQDGLSVFLKDPERCVPYMSMQDFNNTAMEVQTYGTKKQRKQWDKISNDIREAIVKNQKKSYMSDEFKAKYEAFKKQYGISKDSEFAKMEEIAKGKREGTIPMETYPTNKGRMTDEFRKRYEEFKKQYGISKDSEFAKMEEIAKGKREGTIPMDKYPLTADAAMTEGAMRAAVEDGKYLDKQPGLKRSVEKFFGGGASEPYKLSHAEISKAAEALDNVKDVTPKPPVNPPKPPVDPKPPVGPDIIKVDPKPKFDPELIEKTSKFNWKKAGKWGAIALGIAALGAGAYLLVKHLKDKKAEEAQEDYTVITHPGYTPYIPPQPEDVTVPFLPGQPEEDKVQPTTPEGSEDKVQPTTPEGSEEESTTPTTPAELEYTVVKGDCVWKIAKKQLEQELGRKLDDSVKKENKINIALIKKRTNQIAAQNGLRWNSTHDRVFIAPNQKLNIAISAADKEELDRILDVAA